MGADAQGLPGGLCEEGLGSPYARQGWFLTAQNRAQLSPQLSFSHKGNTGKERQNTAHSQGWGKKNVTNRRGNTPKSGEKMFHMVPKQRIHSSLEKAHM